MKTENEKLYIVIPAYNERDNIYQVLDDWYPVVEKHCGGGESRLVVIDDGSKDDTYAIMQEYAKTHPLFQPLTKPNGGHGATVLYGYRYALKQGLIISSRQTPTVRRCRRSLSHSGSRRNPTIW